MKYKRKRTLMKKIGVCPILLLLIMDWITNCLVPYIEKRRQKLGNSLAPCILIMDNLNVEVEHFKKYS